MTVNRRLRAVVIALAAGLVAPLVPLGIQPASAATLVSLAVTPPAASIANGTNQQFTATGTYILPAGTQNDTNNVTWASSNTAVATISNAAGTKGLAQGVGVGTTNITATLGSVTSLAAVLTVTAATLVSIAVTPPAASIANGTTQQFAATGTYTDLSTQDLTTAVTWASSNTGAATISNSAGTKGLATGVGVGATNITATLGSVTSAPAVLTVTAATLASIAVTPPVASIANGTTQQFAATGTYTDLSNQDITNSVTWSSSNTAAATVSNSAGTKGLATGVATGATTITATLGVISGAAALTVTPATLVSITVDPPLASIANGTTQQYAATGTYTDLSQQDLTTSVTWVSSNTAVATISNAAGSEGLATGASPGTTNITATLGSVTSTVPAVLTVTPRPPLTITPNLGPPGTSVHVTNGTFTPGVELVSKYKTGLAHPRGQVICITNALADGTIDCTGQIPSLPKAGATGMHTIIAKIRGDTHASTNEKQSTTYTLTP